MKLMNTILFAIALFSLAGPASADKAWETGQYVPGGKEDFARADLPGFTPLADVNESEPNDTPATANAYVLGDTYHGFLTTSNADVVTFTANAGDVLTAATDADGTDLVDTLIDLIAADGVTVIETDDDDGPGTYSIITRTLTVTGTYYLRVRPFTTSTGNYKLIITAATPPPPPANDTCAGATEILRCTQQTLTGSTALATDNYTPFDSGLGGCTGFTAFGKDVVFSLLLLAGDVLTVTYTSTADGSIYLITDCANEPTSCVVGADATLSGQAETFVYVVASTDTYYLIADSFGTNTSGTYTLAVGSQCPVSVDAISWGHVKAQYR